LWPSSQMYSSLYFVMVILLGVFFRMRQTEAFESGYADTPTAAKNGGRGLRTFFKHLI